MFYQDAKKTLFCDYNKNSCTYVGTKRAMEREKQIGFVNLEPNLEFHLVTFLLYSWNEKMRRHRCRETADFVLLGLLEVFFFVTIIFNCFRKLIPLSYQFRKDFRM